MFFLDAFLSQHEFFQTFPIYIDLIFLIKDQNLGSISVLLTVFQSIHS